MNNTTMAYVVGANEKYNGCATQMGYNGWYWVVPQM